ncbi:MAG: DUF2807 domain-containing protein [Rikenellaceae bacterium]|nr:DUF2807 domain-containing protein [Rikenellaceae bacterium]
MKKITFLVLLMASVLTLSAQKVNYTNADEFNKIVLSGKINATLVQSDKNSFDMELFNTDVNKADWGVKNGTLTIKLKTNTQKESYAEVTIYYKNVNELEIIKSKVSFDEVVDNGIFKVSVSSGGNLSMEVDTKDLSVSADGNSAVMISGDTEYLNIDANAKSKVDARSLEAKSATVRSRFGAEVFVWGTDKLDATSGSSGVIYYKGNPEVLKVSEKMMGSVEQFSL